MNNSLEQLRSIIDSLDNELLALLNRRAALSLRAGEIKRARTAAPLSLRQPDREAAIVARLAELSQSRGEILTAAQIERIYQAIFEVSRQLQGEEPQC